MILSVWLVSTIFLLFPLRLCLAQVEEGQVTNWPKMAVGLSEDSSMGELMVPITAAETKQARWRRDVLMPKLWQLLHQDGAGKNFGALDIDRLKQALAQIQVGQQNKAPKPGPQPQGDRVELTLQKSIEIALKKNLDIQIAELTKNAVETEVPRTKARFHPTVGFIFTGIGETAVSEGDPVKEVNTQIGTAFISQEVPTGATLILSSDFAREEEERATPPREFESALTISLVQPLFRGGRIFVATREIKDAEFDLRIEEAKLRAEVLRVIRDTKGAYYNTVLEEKTIEVTKAAIQRDKTLIEASQALLKAGLVTLRDVASAKISLAKDSARLVSVQANLETRKNDLLDVLGIPIATEVLLLDKDIGFQPVPVELDKWITAADKNRPEILQIEEELAKSELNIRVARNTVLPQVDFVASYDRSQTGSTPGRALDLRGRVWSVGVQFSVPIWNVERKSQLARAKIEHARLQRELLQSKRQIELEVRDVVIKLGRSLARMKALTTQVDQANIKLEVAKGRFTLGVATNLDITDAQEDLLDAETDLLSEIANYNIGLAELEAAIAGPI